MRDSSEAAAERLLAGWGRAGWSRSRVFDARDRADVVDAVTGASTVVARGLGRSYGDQAANAGGSVVQMVAGSAVPRPDPQGWVTLPAGMSIDTVLGALVPEGWFVPVSPGTRHVTIGGAIAADIHGKNHHIDGTFCQHVRQVRLVTADGSLRSCGPDDDRDLFWATAGGLGLTGVIVDATLRMVPIETSRVVVDTSRIDTLDDLMAAMIEADSTAPLSVAWIDLMARRAPGRSVLTTGRFAAVPELPAAMAGAPLEFTTTQRVAAPAMVPNGLLRTSTVRAFNEAWFRMAPRRRLGEVQSINRYFYPLDGVGNWNRVYGRRGFLQWQIAIPDGHEATLSQCVETLSRSGVPCFLAVLKRFGPANPGPLSFPLKGWTLAADMPAGAAGLAETLDQLDRRVADAGGRVYLAKDARMDPRLLNAMYPRLDEWRAVRARVDPSGRFVSDLGRRLGL